VANTQQGKNHKKDKTDNRILDVGGKAVGEEESLKRVLFKYLVSGAEDPYDSGLMHVVVSRPPAPGNEEQGHTVGPPRVD
jgi:hypothetical protein